MSSRAKGSVVSKQSGEAFDVYIGRGSIWGNPFPMRKSAEDQLEERRRVIRKFEEYLLSSDELLNRLIELSGLRLQCFCAPLPCHGDVLVYYADTIAATGDLPEGSALEYIYGS